MPTFNKLKERFDLAISYKCWLEDQYTLIEHSNTLIGQSLYFMSSIMAGIRIKKRIMDTF